ncbi:MAG: FAD:protein FMN transferase [Flavobacteriaceae bacterium]|nr:FAD:protein FMN transferase [Flavobacteriaceae bacterium]
MRLRIILATLIFCISQQLTAQIQEYKKSLKLMGSGFEIIVLANNQKQGDVYIDVAVAEIKRIENIISSWSPTSETSEINRNAGIRPVKVSVELFNLIKRAINISKLTDGAFDISYASMDKIWKFDGSMTKMPSVESIKQSVSKVGYQNIILNKNNNTVFLKLKGMKIGFGAIGKGYAADKSKYLLQKMGVKAGVINASGDMNTWGLQPNGKPWRVGITNPVNKQKVFSWFNLTDDAVVTSGNYEKYVKFNGITYTHIIDPRTGYPAHGIYSATVFSKSAELSDALATSIFVMGIDTGLDFVNQLNGVECVLVDENLKLHFSNKLKTNKY